MEITASFRTFLGPAMAVRIFQTGVQANSTWTVLFISPSISKLCIISRVGVLIRHHQIVSIASVKVTADTSQYVLTLVFRIRGYVHAGAFVKSHLYVHQNAHTLTHTAHVKIYLPIFFTHFHNCTSLNACSILKNVTLILSVNHLFVTFGLGFVLELFLG